MGASAKSHLIFPRRAIPATSWAQPVEAAEPSADDAARPRIKAYPVKDGTAIAGIIQRFEDHKIAVVPGTPILATPASGSSVGSTEAEQMGTPALNLVRSPSGKRRWWRGMAAGGGSKQHKDAARTAKQPPMRWARNCLHPETASPPPGLAGRPADQAALSGAPYSRLQPGLQPALESAFKQPEMQPAVPSASKQPEAADREKAGEAPKQAAVQAPGIMPRTPEASHEAEVASLRTTSLDRLLPSSAPASPEAGQPPPSYETALPSPARLRHAAAPAQEPVLADLTVQEEQPHKRMRMDSDSAPLPVQATLQANRTGTWEVPAFGAAGPASVRTSEPLDRVALAAARSPRQQPPMQYAGSLGSAAAPPARQVVKGSSAALSAAALNTSLCLLASFETSMEASIHTAEVVAHALLARVPFAGPRLANTLAPCTTGPTLPVRAMRRGLNVAFGSAGAFTGVGQGLLYASRALLTQQKQPQALPAPEDK